MCNIVTEFYLYSIVYYIYLINSRLDVTYSVRHHFRIETLSIITVSCHNTICYDYSSNLQQVNVVIDVEQRIMASRPNLNIVVQN